MKSNMARLGVLAVLCATVVAVAGIAVATADSIHACVKQSSGSVRIVASGEACKNSETPLSWGGTTSGGGGTFYVVYANNKLANDPPSPLPEADAGNSVSDDPGPVFEISCDSGDAAVSATFGSLRWERDSNAAGDRPPGYRDRTYYYIAPTAAPFEDGSGLPVGYRVLGMYTGIYSTWSWDYAGDMLIQDDSYFEGWVTCQVGA